MAPGMARHTIIMPPYLLTYILDRARVGSDPARLQSMACTSSGLSVVPCTAAGGTCRRSLRPQRRCHDSGGTRLQTRRGPRKLSERLLITYGCSSTYEALAKCCQDVNRIASCKVWVFAYPVNQLEDVTMLGGVYTGTHAAVSRPPNAVVSRAGKRREA